ncbi:hypothetical protein EMPS_04141 [Entomortierella parvispora]|uniref:Calcineurin-like phosphoesterase domain-containing protein n=1 Tax=Entomortierella parvispora TaxID=205924 RepID=A0A9P3LVA6_9FUNG|nr:hypothetical protein EMPS_04141 [Entomortierella parvispora]
MPQIASSHRQTLATLVVIVFLLVVVALGLNVTLLNQSAPSNSHCIARPPADNNSNDNSTSGQDDQDPIITDDDLDFSDTLFDSTHLAVLKEPTTPPESLPSDPYAHYIYRKVFPLPKSMEGLKGPGGKGPKRSRTRTIVIGDVHGHLDGFNSFLKKISYDKKEDSLILAGDIVTKGDQSLGIIDRARELGAYCVRGNHDDKVVRWRGFLDSLSLVELQSLDETDPENDDYHRNEDVEIDMEDPSSQMKMSPLKKDPSWRPKIPSDLNRKSPHYHLARSMSKAQYQYLRKCPLILSLPRELSPHNIPVHVVHAGIDPSRDILKQKPWVLVNVRNLLKDGTPSNQRDRGLGWAKAFNELHCEKPRKKDEDGLRPEPDLDFMIVYGHDASRSLNVMPWSVGLDTGCVYGRSLTGYVVETGETYSVPCSKPLDVQRMD